MDAKPLLAALLDLTALVREQAAALELIRARLDKLEGKGRS